VTTPVHAPRAGYDWPACAISVVVGLAAAVLVALVMMRLIDSSLLVTTVVTLVGTVMSRWVYARVARRGARPIEDELT
jgi:ABC-type uncharacterized transport system permease subunit